MNREITQAITEDNQMLIEVKDTLYQKSIHTYH